MAEFLMTTQGGMGFNIELTEFNLTMRGEEAGFAKVCAQRKAITTAFIRLAQEVMGTL